MTVGGFLEKGKQIGGFADIHIAATKTVVVQYLSLVKIIAKIIKISVFKSSL